MTKIQTISPDNSAPYKLDNEETNEVGLSAVLDFIAGTDDMVLHHATFDFGSKVLALTFQGLILADCEKGDDDLAEIDVATYGDLIGVEGTGHDREIRLVSRDTDDAIYRMGDSDTIRRLKSLISSYHNQFLSNGDPHLWDGIQQEISDPLVSEEDSPSDEGKIPIGERVRFWQEQDRLNQAVVPRLIAQGELLSQHVVEHENLPRVVSDAVQSALSRQQQRFNEELERISEEYAEQLRTTTEDAVGKVEQENEKTINHFKGLLRKTRLGLSIVVAIGITLGVIAVVIAVI